MLEIWKDIEGYENKYQVSSLGRIRSLNYHSTGKPQLISLTPDGVGYLRLALWRGNKESPRRVHRLVAHAFIPNPSSKPEVNHKNGIKADNRVENLEWCTRQENMTHATKVLGVMSGAGGSGGRRSKRVNQISPEGTLIKTWVSGSQAQKEGGYSASLISLCCNGKLQTYKKLKWQFA